jgi:hypothetical protein
MQHMLTPAVHTLPCVWSFCSRHTAVAPRVSVAPCKASSFKRTTCSSGNPQDTHEHQLVPWSAGARYNLLCVHSCCRISQHEAAFGDQHLPRSRLPKVDAVSNN